MNKDTQSWSNSNLTEMEELLQKVQQLETENAALHRLIDDPNAMHSHYLRKCNGWEVWQAERIHWFQETVDKLERENAALRNELASLKHQTQWECSCGGTDCEGQKENAALRADAERYRWIKRDSIGVHDVLELFMSYINCDLDKEIDQTRAKEAKP
jgi:predicted RNase H-like nuclease (RuvC/YqgF family)